MINKKFVFENNAVILSNFDDFRPFLNENIETLKALDKFSDKENHLVLFKKIEDMCIHDIQTADFSDIAIKAPYFNVDKDNFVYAYNIIFLLGTVYLNVFNRPGIRLSHVEEGINGPIKTNEMFVEAYNELMEKSRAIKPGNSVVAYGATLIFATIFENNLKQSIKQIEVRKYLNTLKSKIDLGCIVLSSPEDGLYNFLYENYFCTGTIQGYDAVRATTTDMYDMLTKYSIINTDNETKKMIKNEYTLNQLINTGIFSSVADTRFINMCKMIFGTGKMNLRNNLAHCNFGYLNYYHINVTVILYILCLMVSEEYFVQ